MTNLNSTSVATKYDGDKAEMWLLPGDALEEVAKVLSFGAKKYAPHNWEKGFNWSRLLSAALRHCFAAARGEWLDAESGLPHVAHAACCLLFLLSHKRRNLGKDDLSRGEAHDSTSAPT
jgi:hypothetical protein